MAIPSDKYDVDYTDGYGFKWTKAIGTIYPNVGTIDESIGLSRYDANIMKTVYRKTDVYNPIYDDSITFNTVPGQSTERFKFFRRNSFPTADVNINTVIVNNYQPDEEAYSVGTDENILTPVLRGSMDSYRLLCDAEYNKMIFRARAKKLNFTTHTNVIQKDTYDDPTYEFKEIKDIDENAFYAYVFNIGCNVWDGASWVVENIAPVLMCTGEHNQTFQGIGSSFNNTMVTYSSAPLGTGQNITLTTQTSTDFYNGQNFQSKMDNDKYCLGFSDSFELRGQWQNDPDATYATIRQWLIDNSIPQLTAKIFEVTREVISVSEYEAVLYTESIYAYLDNNNDLYVISSSVQLFPMITGKCATEFLAGLGLYYLDDYSVDLNQLGITPNTISNCADIWLGEMIADGTTTGKWIKGNDIATYTGYNKDGNVINPDFDPSGGGGGADNPFDVDPETYGWSGGEVSGMVKYYLLTSGEMSQLQTAIASNANWTIDYLNCIVSCFVVPNSGIFFDAPIPTTVKFVLDNAKKWDTGVSCARIQGTVNKSGGTIEIPRLTKTFYDFEPYSDYSVYIPFCGRIPIKGNLCLGREIKVTYYPDVPTCSLTAIVTCGGATIAIAKGSFGTMTPVTSNGSDRKTAAVIGDVAPIITGIGTSIAGVTLGNPLIVGAGAAQALGGIMGGVKESVQSYAYSVGSTGDSSFFGAGNRCYYYANYPIIDDVVNDSMFGHSVGYLCNRVGKLSGFTGFTICANPHVTFSASAEEREEIEKLLSMGVIL